MIAFVREVSDALERCELTHLPRVPIDLKLARKQHARFVAVLEELAVRVEFLPPLPEQPDAVFVEDTAVVLPGLAIVTRPGVPSRLTEVDSIRETLGQHWPLHRIEHPGTLDGGDVLRTGRTIHVAESRRTNPDGITQLRDIVAAHGYEVRVVTVRDCLHLKSACTFIPPHFLVANAGWINTAAFGNLVVIRADESEPFGANTVTIGDMTLVSASFPKTEQRLRDAGIKTQRVEISEFEKAEGGLTCLSLIGSAAEQ
ncbi:MAG: hypothetical protein Q7S40_25560 [Opitutaceae bacterium]|nr:hypothetical protein [Opitutaceae bacterium]